MEIIWNKSSLMVDICDDLTCDYAERLIHFNSFNSAILCWLNDFFLKTKAKAAKISELSEIFIDIRRYYWLISDIADIRLEIR